jgi:hypothetical protein
VCIGCFGCARDAADGRATARSKDELAIPAAHAARQRPPDNNKPDSITYKPGRERVRTVKHHHFKPDGTKPNQRYRSLVPDAAHYLFPWEDSRLLTKPRPPGTPIPDIIITNGWLYVSGDAPCVGTTAVVAQSTSTRLLLYYFPIDNQTNGCRICYLEGDEGNKVYVYARPDGPEELLTLGHYVDAVIDANGAFVEWRYADAGGHPDPREINTALANDQAHGAVMWEVNRVMYEDEF